MLVESLGTSLIIGKIRGGSFSNIASEEIKGWGFIVLSFVLEYGTVFFAGRGYSIVKNNILYIHIFTYLLLFIGLIINLKKYPFCIITIGVLLNFIVIFANGGQMPVSKEALESVGLLKNISLIENGSAITHRLIDSGTKLRYLADIFSVGKKGFFPSVFSIGDIFMSVGIFIYIQKLMLKKDK